jgi:prepilin-type N-terminal cleavage/methylation domain-containing protein
MSIRGYSLIELVTVILLIGILSSMTVVYVGNNMDAARYAETVQRLQTLQKAIIGDDTVDNSGHRTHFGFIGDIGRMPTALTELTTRGALPVWVYNYTNAPCSGTCNAAAGWRGPYVNSQFTASLAVDADAWGNAYIYNTSNTATITSYGADGVSGGTGYAKDVTLQIPQAQMFASVRGNLMDGDMPCTNQSVTIMYPANGLPTSTSVNATATGAFTFTAIPYGVRAIKGGTDACNMNAPRRFVVEKPTTTISSGVTVSNNVGIYFDGGPSIQDSAGNSNDQVWFNFDVMYPTSTMTPTYLTITWTMPAYLYQIDFDPSGNDNGPFPQTFTPALTSGTRFAITTGAILSSPFFAADLKMVFRQNPDGTGYADMTGANVIVNFEWAQTTRKDTLISNLF